MLYKKGKKVVKMMKNGKMLSSWHYDGKKVWEAEEDTSPSVPTPKTVSIVVDTSPVETTIAYDEYSSPFIPKYFTTNPEGYEHLVIITVDGKPTEDIGGLSVGTHIVIFTIPASEEVCGTSVSYNYIVTQEAPPEPEPIQKDSVVINVSTSQQNEVIEWDSEGYALTPRLFTTTPAEYSSSVVITVDGQPYSGRMRLTEGRHIVLYQLDSSENNYASSAHYILNITRAAQPEQDTPNYIVPLNYDPTAPFNRAVGNPGVFKIDKAPEDITVEDVINACELPSLYNGIDDDDLPVGLGANSATPHIWTAAEIGLQEGDTNAIGEKNCKAIRAAVANSNCIGIKLDKRYALRMESNPVNSTYSKNPSTVKGKSIVLPRNFIIDGEVNGEAVGGFHVRTAGGYGNAFYTEHSLKLNKIDLYVWRKEPGPTFYINTVNGVDKLEVSGCLMDGHGKGRCSTAIYVYSDQSSSSCPHDENWVPSPNYYINHIYIHDCIYYGSTMLLSSGCGRVTSSFRIVNNSITEIRGNGIDWSTEGSDSKVYADVLGYMSCPIYVAGNTIEGKNGLYRINGITELNTENSGFDSYYYDGLMIENNTLYVLWNTFAHFYSGGDIKADGTWNAGTPTYELYFNGSKLYYTNNEVTNVIKYRVGGTTTSGIMKAKGSCISKRVFDDPNVITAELHTPVIRYYKKNKFILDAEEARRIWNSRTPLTNQVGIEEEDKITAELDNIITLQLDNYIGNPPVDEFVFSENLIDAGTGNINGVSTGANQRITKLTIESNVWKAARISSLEWGWNSDNGYITSATWLFMVRFTTYYGNTWLHVSDNKFYITNSEQVNFINSKYMPAESETGMIPKPSDYVFTTPTSDSENANDITVGGKIRTIVTNMDGWSTSRWETIDGTLTE